MPYFGDPESDPGGCQPCASNSPRAAHSNSVLATTTSDLTPKSTPASGSLAARDDRHCSVAQDELAALLRRYTAPQESVRCFLCEFENPHEQRQRQRDVGIEVADLWAALWQYVAVVQARPQRIEQGFVSVYDRALVLLVEKGRTAAVAAERQESDEGGGRLSTNAHSPLAREEKDNLYCGAMTLFLDHVLGVNLGESTNRQSVATQIAGWRIAWHAPNKGAGTNEATGRNVGQPTTSDDHNTHIKDFPLRNSSHAAHPSIQQRPPPRRDPVAAILTTYRTALEEYQSLSSAPSTATHNHLSAARFLRDTAENALACIRRRRAQLAADARDRSPCNGSGSQLRGKSCLHRIHRHDEQQGGDQEVQNGGTMATTGAEYQAQIELEVNLDLEHELEQAFRVARADAIALSGGRKRRFEIHDDDDDNRENDEEAGTVSYGHIDTESSAGVRTKADTTTTARDPFSIRSCTSSRYCCSRSSQSHHGTLDITSGSNSYYTGSGPERTKNLNHNHFYNYNNYGYKPPHRTNKNSPHGRGIGGVGGRRPEPRPGSRSGSGSGSGLVRRKGSRGGDVWIDRYRPSFDDR